MPLPIEPTEADFGVTAKDLALAERWKAQEKVIFIGLYSVFVALGVLFYAEELGFLGGLVLGLLVFGGSGALMALVGLVIIERLVPSLRRVEKLQQARKRYRFELLRLERDFWLGLRGRAFEVQLANVLSGLGYRTELTPASGDGGVDLVVTIDEQRVIIQCKALKKPAGPAVVRELYGTLQTSGAAHAVLAAPMGWTAGAQKYCSGLPISLWDVGRILEIVAGRPLFKGAAETDLK